MGDNVAVSDKLLQSFSLCTVANDEEYVVLMGRGVLSSRQCLLFIIFSERGTLNTLNHIDP